MGPGGWLESAVVVRGGRQLIDVAVADGLAPRAKANPNGPTDPYRTARIEREVEAARLVRAQRQRQELALERETATASGPTWDEVLTWLSYLEGGLKADAHEHVFVEAIHVFAAKHWFMNEGYPTDEAQVLERWEGDLCRRLLATTKHTRERIEDAKRAQEARRREEEHAEGSRSVGRRLSRRR
jgi:hypothetical protein